jgi:hypothetical protein
MKTTFLAVIAGAFLDKMVRSHSRGEVPPATSVHDDASAESARRQTAPRKAGGVHIAGRFPSGVWPALEEVTFGVTTSPSQRLVGGFSQRRAILDRAQHQELHP